MKEKVLAFLQSHQVMVLATVDSDNKPYCSPLLYVADDAFNLYFFTHDDSRKTTHIYNNNSVAVSIWSHNEYSLQIEGIATEIEDRETFVDKISLLAAAAAKESPTFSPPILRVSREMNYVVYKIVVSRLRYIDLSNPKIKEYTSALKELPL